MQDYIGLSELEAILSKRNKAEPVTIVIRTYPERSGLRKTDNRFYGLCHKITRTNGFIGSGYESRINRQREREGHSLTFKAESIWRGKGKHVEGSRYFITHVDKGGLYLAFSALTVKDKHPRVLQQEYQWIKDSKPLTESETAEYKTFERKRKASGRQETEKPIFWQLPDLTNLIQITIGGQTYPVRVTEAEIKQAA